MTTQNIDLDEGDRFNSARMVREEPELGWIVTSIERDGVFLFRCRCDPTHGIVVDAQHERASGVQQQTVAVRARRQCGTVITEEREADNLEGHPGLTGQRFSESAL